jgi:microcystin-dependent protein
VDAFIAQIMLFAGNFAPANWAFCNGQLMSIAQNSALFSLIGTVYGGDGIQTFALPNLQCRFPIHPGSVPGFSPIAMGDSSGVQAVTLLQANLPAHSHPLNVSNATGYQGDPTGALLAQPNTSVDPRTPGTATAGYVPATSGVTGQAAPSSIGSTGNGIPVPILPPYVAINFIICLNGIYPSRP